MSKDHEFMIEISIRLLFVNYTTSLYRLCTKTCRVWAECIDDGVGNTNF